MSRQERTVIPTPRLPVSSPQLEHADIVIVGNGIAGLTAAVEARHLAPDKHIVIITEQVHPTINTPALKQFAMGKLTRQQLLAYPAGTERMERIIMLTARVEDIHAHSKYVTLKGGRCLGYGSLLLATGSAPIGLPDDLPGRNFDGVCMLHRLQDYLDLRRRLSEVNDAVVIGGGMHAIETVMGLLYWGVRVHWLIRSETFMPRMLDRVASDMVLDRVRHAGAVIYTGTEVIGIMGRVGTVAGVITNNKEMIPCQLVLTCTGTTPVTTLAEHCTASLQHKRGIYVDDLLRTNVPNIYAAGDVAALKNPLTGEYEPRAQWYAAVSQGRVAAAAMTGHLELAQQPFGVQWHATHLGDLSMLTVGSPLDSGPHMTTLTDSGQGGYRRVTMRDERLIGYLSLGPTQPDGLAIKRIIDEGLPVQDILRSLLKGNFEARKYFSQKYTQAAHGLLTSTKLPALIAMPKVSLSTGQLPMTGPLPSAQPRGTDTDGMPIVVESTLIPVETSSHDARSLWSYSDTHSSHQPTVQRTREKTPGKNIPRRTTTGSLWSYGAGAAVHVREKKGY